MASRLEQFSTKIVEQLAHLSPNSLQADEKLLQLKAMIECSLLLTAIIIAGAFIWWIIKWHKTSASHFSGAILALGLLTSGAIIGIALAFLIAMPIISSMINPESALQAGILSYLSGFAL